MAHGHKEARVWPRRRAIRAAISEGTRGVDHGQSATRGSRGRSDASSRGRSQAAAARGGCDSPNCHSWRQACGRQDAAQTTPHPTATVSASRARGMPHIFGGAGGASNRHARAGACRRRQTDSRSARASRGRRGGASRSSLDCATDGLKRREAHRPRRGGYPT
eukprot:7263143-Prymnesium_polylepis.1